MEENRVLGQAESESRPREPDDEDESLLGMIQRRLNEKKIELPNMPTITAEIMRVSQDPETSINTYTKLFSRDQALAAKVISMANSTFYRGMKNISTVPEAITRIGINGLRNIVLAIGVKNAYAAKDRRFQEEIERLWLHAVAIAVCCQELASLIQGVEKEEAFLAGLVHDIGKVFIIINLEAIAKTDDRIATLPENVFFEILSSMHEEMGADLLLKWNFPAIISEAVRYHRRPDEAQGQAMIAWVIKFANLVSAKLGLDGREPDSDLHLGATPAIKVFDFNDLDVAKLIVNIEDKVEEMQIVMG